MSILCLVYFATKKTNKQTPKHLLTVDIAL